jgi:hypothetical protein
MKVQRRHLPMLEALDLRIVPSTVGITPHQPVVAAAAGHALVANSGHHAIVHHPAKVHTHHHTPLRPTPTPTPTGYTSPVYTYGSPSAMQAVRTHSATAAARSATPAADPATPATTASTSGPLLTQAAGSTSTTAAAPVSTPSSNINDPENGPLAKAGFDLFTIYQEFEAQGGSSTFTSSKAGTIRFHGTSVGIDAHMAGGSFSTYVSALTALGMQVQTQDATHGVVEGYLPISQLPAAAENPQTLALTPIYIPRFS